MQLNRQERLTLTALGVTALVALSILMWQRQRAPLTIEAASSSVTSAPWDQRLTSARQIDLNTAGVSELQRLPGIGPVLAERILAYRIQHGRFHDPLELERVSGIGPKTVQAIEDYMTVR